MEKSKSFLHSLANHFKFGSNRERSNEADIQRITAQEQKIFAYDTLLAATKNFNPVHKLGEGGFGPVFKGKLSDGREIAVKKLSLTSKQGKKEFINEAKLLARVQHRNVVNLWGYCVYGAEKLLVYEYVPHESLDKLLFNPHKREQLDWKRRFGIITGVAKGLLYLHEDSHDCIIHRDIKASNILLDDKWTPKIADFGMARLFPEDQTQVNTRVAGTNGYMAPEYMMHGKLSVKADVFSYGVLVLELITGQRNSSFNLDVDALSLLDWAYKMYKKGKSLDIVDPSLASTMEAEQVSTCIQLALLCTQGDPQLRPTMRRVVVMLSRKPGHNHVEEPTRPGVPGSRYRRPRRHSALSSTGGTSGSHSSDTSYNSTSGTVTATGTSSRDEIKQKVEIKFNELGDMCERGELEPEAAYEQFKKFEDEMVMEYMKIMEKEEAPQSDDTAVPDKKKESDDPPGEGPILRWVTRAVFAPGGDAWHPKNRKVKLSVTVKELGLSKYQFRRLRELVGKRYHPGRDELTITSERYEHREENRKDCLRTLLSLIEEAGKANKLVDEARTSYAKERLRANPAFMARLHAKSTRVRESNQIPA